MATDYGGTHGDPPWHGAQPSYSGQPPYPGQPAYPDAGGPPGYEPTPPTGPASRRRRSSAGFLIGVTATVLGLAGLAAALLGVATQLLPRHFTARQRQQITNWELGRRWRDLPASQIFPASAHYVPPAALDDDPALTLGAQRIGIARQATCRGAADPAAAAVLDRDGCAGLLAATYADSTDSYVVTVGVAVLPDTAKAAAAAKSLNAAATKDGIPPGVHALSFARTPAEWFTNPRRQLSGAISAGSYVLLYTAGYADSRPREPVSNDSYGNAEMTAAAVGVAQAVLTVLAAPVAAPSCPGTPGC